MTSLPPSSKPNLLKLPFVVPMPTKNSATETVLVGRPRASSSFAKAFAKASLVDRRLPRRLPAQYQHECFCREATCSTCTLCRWSSCWGRRGTRLSPSNTPCTSPFPPKWRHQLEPRRCRLATEQVKRASWRRFATGR